MTDLDKKLREILTDVASRDLDWESVYEPDIRDEDVAQLKQAFAEAGYVKIADPPESVTLPMNSTYYEPNIMTGQEWYNKLVKAWLALPKDHGFVDMQEAAKKAAGLE